MRSHSGPKKNAIIPDLAPHEILFTKLKQTLCSTNAPSHNHQTDLRPGNTRQRGSNVNNINSDSSLWVKSSYKNASSSRSWSTRTAMPIWHKQLQCAPESFSSPSSVTLIKNAPFCRFCLPKKHPTTQCPVIWPQLRATFIDPRQADLRSFARLLRRYPSNSYSRCSATKYGSTQMTQGSINPSNTQPLLNCEPHLRTCVSQNLLHDRRPQKIKREDTRNGNSRTIWPFTRWCLVIHTHATRLIYHITTKMGSVTFIHTKTEFHNKTDGIAGTDIKLPPQPAQYVFNIHLYDCLHGLASFFCMPSYDIKISNVATSDVLLTVAIVHDTSTGSIKMAFLPPAWKEPMSRSKCCNCKWWAGMLWT